jgi:hypothetical protein
VHRSSPASALRLVPLLLLALITLAIPSNLQSETFKNPRRIPLPVDPVALVVGDINGDGRTDILYGTGQYASAVLHPLLAQPNGSFTPGADIPLPTTISSRCKLADINGDHVLDLVCAGFGLPTSSIAILKGNGDGTFQSAILSNLPATTSILHIAAIGDINNDGHPDVIVTDTPNSVVFPLLGDGTGHFNPAPIVASGASPVLGKLYDLNGDGNLDLLVQGNDGYSLIYLGKGDGTFATGTAFKGFTTVVLGDIDGDTHPDLIGGGGGQLTILHGNPDGTFNPSPIVSTNFISGNNPKSGFANYIAPLALIDLNGDGIPDLVAYATDGLTVFLGQPGLKFGPASHYPVARDFFGGEDPNDLVDINGDGYLDFIAAGPNGIYIIYGRGDGTFSSAAVTEFGSIVAYATMADFNKDGILDLVTTGDPKLHIRLGKGDGTFGPLADLPGGAGVDFTTPNAEQYAHIVHGDFNGDGKQDVVAIGSPTFGTYVPYLFVGHGDGTFDAPIATSIISRPSVDASPMSVVDINKDGRDDIVTFDVAKATIYLAQANGSFSSSITIPLIQDTPNDSSFPAFADVTGDGILDAIYSSSQHVYILPGRGDGTFNNPIALTIPPIAGAFLQGSGPVVIGDFDGDGRPDISVLVPWARMQNDQIEFPTQLFTFYNLGNSSFTVGLPSLTSFHSFTHIQSADVDQDGRADLLFDNGGDLYAFNGPVIGIVHGQANRTLSVETDYVAGTGLSSVFVADLNHDGLPDIIAANGDYNATSNAVTILLNQGNATNVTGTLTIAPEPSLVAQPITLTAALSPPTGVIATLAGNITFSIDGNAVGTAPLTSNTATLVTSAPLAIGTHQVTATWSGDSTYPAITLTTPHLVVGIPVTLNLASSANAASVGQQISLTTNVVNVAGVPAGSPGPTGTIALTDNGTLFATSTITAPGVILTNSLLLATAGTHTIVAAYSGDANHAAATSTITVQVAALPTTVTISSSANPAPYGLAITFTATVTANPALFIRSLYNNATITLAGLPGGPISVPVTLSASGSSAGVAIGIATYTIATLQPGSYPVTASFSGNNSTTASVSAPLTQVIRQAISSTALSVTPNPAYTGQTVTFAVTVNSPAGSPTGTVLLFDGGLPLATITLNPGSSASTGGSAQAFFATALLGVGTHTLSARYSGDTSNLVSFSPNVSETILLSTFTLTLNPATLSLQTGHHSTLTFSATSIGSFTDTLHLTTGNLPVYTTLTFTPATLQLPANGTATSSISVDTDFILGFLSQNDPHSTPPQATSQKLHPAIALALSTLTLTPLALLLPLALRRRNRMRLPTLLAAVIAFAMLYSASGCSGRQPPSTVPGTYNIQITATPTFSQTPITITLPLTITP